MHDKAIVRLRRLHLDASRKLDTERERRVPDFAQMARLKKLKLAIKDRIAALASRSALSA